MSEKFQFKHTGKVIGMHKEQLHYKISTNDGQSGAPVMKQYGDGFYQVIGIHTAGSTNHNVGVKFDHDVKLWILKKLLTRL